LLVETEEDDDMDLVAPPTGDAAIRFGLYFLVIGAAHIMLANSLSDGFLARFSHPGMAITHMRSAQPELRRLGMKMLTERMDFRVTPAIEKVVLTALDDPDEGVAARAAFVVGMLSVDAAVPRLERLVVEQPALTFVALISLGQVGSEAARSAARRLADTPAAQSEPHALALCLGMLKVAAPAQLKSILDTATDTDIRIAALWALGQGREARLLPLFVEALQDADLGIRCAAAGAIENLIVLEASEPLQAAFLAVKDPLAVCPERLVPVQEGGAAIAIVPHRNYQLALVRALATTDDPRLIQWLVGHQEGVESRTHRLMEKVWERLVEKDKRGELNGIKRRLRLLKVQEGALAPGAPTPVVPGGVIEGGGP
jgi:HEAT repeat protein